MGTKIIQALKLILSMIAPANNPGVIAAKTNWKKTIVDIGMLIANPLGPMVAWLAMNPASSVGVGIPSMP